MLADSQQHAQLWELYLWRHILHSANRADGHLLLHAHGQPKVSQLHAPITANENVFQLDIPALACISQPAATSRVHMGHPIASQLHAPITADENVVQLDIPALGNIFQPAATSKVHVGRAHSSEWKLEMDMVSELQ